MKPQALNDWQELSALYEQADALEDADLDIWLTQLRGQGHPLLGQLEQMLDAREQVKRNGFLDAPPALRLEAEPLAHEWREDSRVGAYRLLRRLGAGGMAEVWLAQRDDGAFQRQVAIKLLFRHASQLGGATGSTQRDSFAQRFSRERDILASLHHPNIASLHDAGVTPTGQPWLALEYVEGEPLTDWCNQRQLGVEARVRLFRQVLLAVQHAHANLVIHRDLKPANILVTAQGEVRLLDFGIAKLMEPEGGNLVETELTRMAGRPLTVAYASPEQLLGQPLSTACDVYSLGVVLYEMLCGERPYELKVETAAQLEQAILDVEPRAPSRRVLTEATAQARGTTPQVLRKQLASDLDAIALRALGKRPSQRYGSVEALRADIDRWLAGEAVGARTPSALYHLRKFVGRHPVGVSLGVAAIASLVAAAAVAVWQGVQAREESARAVAARDFMLNIFQRADQEKSRGATVTARDLLETGRKDVMTRLVGQPKLQAELLQGIAKIQARMGEYVSADSTYRDLIRIYGELGDTRSAVIAATDLASNASLGTRDSVSAAELLAAARAMPGRLANDVEVEARLSDVEGSIAMDRGDAKQARELFQRSQRGYIATLGPDDLHTFDVGRRLAQTERALRNFDGAIALYDRLDESASRVVGLDDRVRAGLDGERLDVLYAAGAYSRALALAEAAEPRCARVVGLDSHECRLLSLRKGVILLRLGRIDLAIAALPRLVEISRDVQAPYTQSEAMLLRLRIESASNPSGSPSSFDEVRHFGESDATVAIKPVFKVAALLGLSESRLHGGDAAEAQRWAEQALSLNPRGSTLAVGRSLLGVAMVAQGKLDQGLEAMRLAAKDFEGSLGENHPMTQLFALNQVLSLERMGKRTEALALLDRAQPVLLKGFGEGAPTYARVLALRARLEYATSRPSVGAKRPAQGTIEFFS